MSLAPLRGPQLLEQNVGHTKSQMGAFFPGSHVIFRGQDLHAELKDMDWVELFVFGITGRRFSKAQLRLLQTIWTTTSYPDVRIWNNRVAALAGTARSTGNLGVSAALAVSEASIYGRGIDIRAIDFLIRARRQVESDHDLAAFVQDALRRERSIAGYGRPLVSRDERIEHLLALAQELGLADGPYLSLAYAVRDVLKNGRWRQEMNYAGLAAALAADLGLSPREYYLYLFPAFLAGMLPCFIEAAENPEGSLFPLPCTHLKYEGVAKRSWAQREKR
ncbi:MAG TPA: hypothetical protein VFW68_00130 [Rhodocyclaceae bacterium]|nr:hypothetical protein [Rhodocyclaceae bacterium]